MSDDMPQRLGAAMVKRALDAAARAPVDDLDVDEAAALHVRTPDELTALRWSSRVPQRFVRAQLDDLQGRPVHDRLVDWSTRAAGRNLVLIGPTGVGKTHAAIAACRHAHELGLDVVFAPAVELLDRLRPGRGDDALDGLLDADRLIVDDLGAERSTDWTTERLYLVINRRWLDERPTVVTSNLDSAQLALEIGERMFSRLVGSGAVTLRMAGDDLRRRKP